MVWDSVFAAAGSVAAQTGTLSYGTGGTATYAVTSKNFSTPAFAPSVDWKSSGATWSTTAPTGITSAVSGSDDCNHYGSS